AVILRYQEGLPSKEIAARLGITDAAARQRIARGIARLRVRLEQRYGKGRDGWIAALMPLWQSPGAVPASFGGLALVSAAVVLFAAAAGSWHLLAPPDPIALPPAAVERSSVAADAAAGERAPQREPVGPVDRPAAAAPVGDPFAAIDRDRDLFGRVCGPDQAPLAGALVRAMPVDHGTYLPAAAVPTEVLCETTTDAAGRFRLHLRRDQHVDLRVSARGFGEEVLPDRDAGEHVDVTLVAAAKVRGRLVDALGGPLGAVPVRAVRIWMTDGAVREVARTSTAADGRFSLPGLAAGRTVLEFATPGALARPVVVDLEPGQSLDRVFAVQPVRTVSVQVVDGDSGAPIAGARVTVAKAVALPADAGWRPPSRDYTGSSWAGSPGAGSSGAGSSGAGGDGPRTDAAGRLDVPVASDYGHVLVTVSAAGYASMARPLRAERSGAGQSGGGHAETLRFALRRGGTVRGRLIDEDGRAIAGARVSAQSFGVVDGLAQGEHHQVESGPDGSFAFACLRRDLELRVIARSPGRATVVRPVAWPQQATVQDLGAVPMPAGAIVRGVLRARNGSPCPDVHVLVSDARATVLARVRSDDLGRFAVADLPPEPLHLHAGDADAEVAPPAGGVVEPVELTISAEQVAGVVTDPLGEPIHNAMVLLLSDRAGVAKARQVTDREGRFTFRSVGGDRFELVAAPNSVHLPGGDRMVHPVRLGGILPGPRRYSVVMPWAAVTRGVVVDEEGSPRPRTMVFARTAGGELVTYEFTDPDGTFVLRLPPGSIVDLCVGKENPRRVALRGVRAGATDVRLVQAR
ncbi:MAG TPA: hypothetical protein ENI87_05530, partial [bacterium]|nr:hypothetical protein [bacterium]